MPRKPKDLDDDTITSIINEFTDKQVEETRPTAAEIQRRYNDIKDDSVHEMTMRNYLQRTDRYKAVNVADYTGWKVQ